MKSQKFAGILDCPGWYGAWTIQSAEKSDDVWTASSNFFLNLNEKNVSREVGQYSYSIWIDRGSEHKFSYIYGRHPNLALQQKAPFSIKDEIEGVLKRLSESGKKVSLFISKEKFEIKAVE